MFSPPAKFCKILISRLIFFFLTGLRTLITHLSSLTMLTPSKTSEYCASEEECQREHYKTVDLRAACSGWQTRITLCSGLTLPRPTLRTTS